MPEAIFVLFILGSLVYLLPFVVNFFLARTRGKNILFMLVLTIPFSYLVTVILALLPEVEKEKHTTVSGGILALFYIVLIVVVSIPMYRFMAANAP